MTFFWNSDMSKIALLQIVCVCTGNDENNHCLTPESGKRVQRSTSVSTSFVHTPSEDVCMNEVEASKTPQKDRTKCAPIQRPTQGTTISMRATHPSSAPSVKALEVGDVLVVLAAFPQAVVEVGLLLFLNVQRANPIQTVSRHPLGSSSSWHALHNLIVLSVGNSCCSFCGHHLMNVPQSGLCQFSSV